MVLLAKLYVLKISLTCVKAQGPLRCDLHKVVVTSNDDWSVFDNVKDLRGIYERGGKSNGRVKTFKTFGLETKSSLGL